MYIIKNSLRCIARSKGRNVLIGIIALVIAVSACIGLSIRQAAENAKASTLEGMSVTANISYNRQNMMQNMTRPGAGGGFDFSGFDKNQFQDMMGNASSLTLDEYLIYANASSVSDFYYTVSAYVNGSEGFDPVSTSSSSTSDSSSGGSMGGFFPGNMPDMGASGDFTLIGYSSDNAMVDFTNGTSSVTDGSVFEEGTADYSCIISEELAIYNSLSVGDTILIINPNNESEGYTLSIVGIYTSTESNSFASSMFGANQDPANRILMSAAALNSIAAASGEREDNGTKTKISGNITATYVFQDVDDYYAFEDEVRELGLDSSYAVSSSDITAFENSLTPLKTLSTMAGWFLIVILAIGAVILVVLNVFNVRERKYEIGVLTAMGMKKWKVATQFICEILVVTMIAIFIGAGIGAVSSVPVTNALLENQIESQTSNKNQINNNFGRPGNTGFGGMGSMPDMGAGIPDKGGFGGGMGFPEGGFMDNVFGGAANYVTEIDSAMNLTVVLQMICIGLLLTLVASAVSVVFVMRYDPLKILSNRD